MDGGSIPPSSTNHRHTDRVQKTAFRGGLLLYVGVLGVSGWRSALPSPKDGSDMQHVQQIGEGEVLPLAPDEDLHDYFRSLADEDRERLYAHLRGVLADLADD